MSDDDLAGHDQLWQELLEKFFRDFLELTVPDFAAKLHLDRKLAFLREKGWGPPVSLKSRRGRLLICDLVVRVKVRQPPPRSLVVNVEVERAFRQKTEKRLYRYQRSLALRHSRQPVLSIVLFLQGGPEGVVRSELRESLWGIELNAFSYYAFGLAKCRAEDWLVRPQPLAVALAALMRSDRWSRVEHKLRCLQAVARAEVDDRGRFLLFNAVETYLKLDRAEDQQLEELLSRESHTEVRDMTRTWADQIRHEGVQEGKARGRVEGMEQHARGLLMRLLKQRFGPLPTVTLDRLATIRDLAELDRLAERLMRAKSLGELGLA